MTKPAFIYFPESTHLLILVDVLSRRERDAFIQIHGRISRGVTTAEEISGEDISFPLDSSSAWRFQSELSVPASRERSASKRRGRIECGKRRGRILPRKSIFFVETSFRWGRFKRREAASLARKHVLSTAALLAPLGSSVAWRILCSVVNGFYERGLLVSNVRSRGLRVHRSLFSVRVREDFSFSSFSPSFFRNRWDSRDAQR